jgi:hypothetical protein
VAESIRRPARSGHRQGLCSCGRQARARGLSPCRQGSGQRYARHYLGNYNLTDAQVRMICAAVLGEDVVIGFGRKAEIGARAKSVGDLMLLIVGCVNCVPLRELIEANHRRGSVDGAVDLTKGEHAFFERDPKSNNVGSFSPSSSRTF